ncbi:MAG TPA: DUF3515 domain-containing protein [Candidatus Corynebacterium avicola]|uniref:DUF3515 domain-containing protein n=1 Tax=Candidatus Corynebacterium avicola TaxID=2838527 RepID=A0A9D1RQD6_9CORY|nr:DUF3515 domain-containing protein [Candidatus Corynebacterium avicola]
MSSRPNVTDQGSSTPGHENSGPENPGSGADTDSDRGSSRRTAVIALILSVVFVAAVLAGAKILIDRNVYTPVSMGPVDAPDAESDACTGTVDDLPDRLGDFRDVGVTDPAPAGTAGFRDSGGSELTVRCGVSAPAQFTEVSELTDAQDGGGTPWLEINDATPGSELSTWYAVGQSPVVAVTTDAQISANDLAGLGESITEHGSTDDAPDPAPVPLSDLEGSGSDACGPLEDALPETIGDYRRITETPDWSGNQDLDGAIVWTASGREPVVLRCGVSLPDSYEAGAQLTQVNDVPWFEDTALTEGSTAGVWYALGHEEHVAVSLPTDAGDAVITQVSQVISDTMESTERTE